MNLYMFSLFDSKTGAFSPPFFVNHRGHALRMVQELGRDTNTTVGRYPEDYTLFELGFFDDATGQVEMMRANNLGQVASLIPQAPQGKLFDRTADPVRGGE